MFEPEIENKSLTAPNTPLKKKRGRPFKKQAIAQDAELGSLLTTPEILMESSKPKRGRPFKKKEAVKTPTLTRDEYWKFTALGLEHAIALEKQKLINLALKNLEKDAEILQVKMQSLKGDALSKARIEIEQAGSAFQQFKELLESKLGVSLNGAAIDEETLTVKSLT